MNIIHIPATTNASGAAAVTDTRWVVGKLYAIAYFPGTLDTGATVTVTCEGRGTKPLLTKASAGTSNTWYYPRDLVHAVADGAALTGTAGGDRDMPILDGKIKLTIASGGNTLTGAIVAYYTD